MADDLTQDEVTVLMLCAQGESIAAIGRWETPCNSLVSKGLLSRHDKFNHGLLPAGRHALQEWEKAGDRAIGQALEGIGKVQAVQGQITDFAEQAAQLLASAAKASSMVTSDSPEHACRKWSDIIYSRAMQVLR